MPSDPLVEIAFVVSVVVVIGMVAGLAYLWYLHFTSNDDNEKMEGNLPQSKGITPTRSEMGAGATMSPAEAMGLPPKRSAASQSVGVGRAKASMRSKRTMPPMDMRHDPNPVTVTEPPLVTAIPTMASTTTPAPGPTNNGNIRDQPVDTNSQVKMPSPMEHRYDPKFPPTFPLDDTKQTAPEPVTSAAQSMAASEMRAYNAGEGTIKPLPTTTAAPMITTKPAMATADPVVMSPGHALQGTTAANEYKADHGGSTIEEAKMCPPIAPTGKLELAIMAWNNSRRVGHQRFGDGKTIDMGHDGGWYDVDKIGCCNYYCRRVNVSQGLEGVRGHWSCISPHSPNTEYTKLDPSGHACSSFAGQPVSMPSS
jgi:hypothetical protein